MLCVVCQIELNFTPSSELPLTRMSQGIEGSLLCVTFSHISGYVESLVPSH